MDNTFFYNVCVLQALGVFLGLQVNLDISQTRFEFLFRFLCFFFKQPKNSFAF